MLNRIRPRLTYANVMVTVLLFIVLGGGAYAAFKAPKNSVGTNALKNSAVTNKKVKKGTLTSDKFAAGTLQQGPTGPKGEQGPPGPGDGVLSAVDFASLPGSSTNFAPVSGRTGQAIAAPATADSLSPDLATVAKSLSVKLNVAPTGGIDQSFTVTLMVNDAASGLICTVIAPATTCTSAGPVPVPAGSLISLRFANASTTAITTTSTGFLLAGS